MILNKEEVEKIRPGRGRVIVRIPYVLTPEFVLGEKKFSFSAKSDEAKILASARYGTVLSVNDQADWPKLNYSWDGPVEVEPGDQVWFTQDAIAKISLTNKEDEFHYMYEDNGEVINLLLLPYKELVLRKRGDEFLALNDYLICNRVKKESPSSLIILDHTSLVVDEPDMFEIVYAPSGNLKYDWRKNFPLKSNWKKVECSVGEIVKTRRINPIDLEFSYNRILEPFIYFQSHSVIAKQNG